MRIKHISLVTLFTGLNLVATVLNQLALGYLFGAGASMDAFLISGAVPFAILNLAIGDMGYALVPLLMRSKQEGEELRAIDSTFSAIGLVSLAVAAVGVLAHRPILRLTTSAGMPQATFELASSLSPVIWLIMGLTVLGSYLTGLHHYRRSFSSPAMTLALPYLGMTAGGLLGARSVGIAGVAFGWALGTLARDLLLYLALPGRLPRLSSHPWHPASRRLLRALLPLGLSLMPFTVLPMIDVYWASRLPVGSISYLGLSNRIAIALTGMVVQGISVVLFPELSELLLDRQVAAFRARCERAMKVVLAIAFPMTFIAIAVRGPVLDLLLVRGRFTAAAAAGVAKVLPLYLLGAVWMAAMNLVSRAFYALEDYATPAMAGALALTLYIALSGWLIGPFSYSGIGMAYAVFWMVTFFGQVHLLGRAVGPLLTRDFLLFTGKVLAGSTLAGLGVAALIGPALSALGRPAGLPAAAASGLVLFLISVRFLFNIPRYRVLLAALQRP